jgi:succinyl-CoA synthetase beta subunit
MNVPPDALRTYLASFDIPVVDGASSFHFQVRISADLIQACPVIAVLHGSAELGREYISPLLGLRDYQARNLGNLANLPREYWAEFVYLAGNLYRCYLDADALRLQLDGLTDTGGRIAATGCAMQIDDNALFRQRHLLPPDQDYRHELTFRAFKGQIGVLANGSGLAMATMDMIVHYSENTLRAAAFTDIGNTLRVERVTEALNMILGVPHARVVLVALFAADQCAHTAHTIIEAAHQVEAPVPPIIVFLSGLDAEHGRTLIERARSPFLIGANTLREAVRRAIHLTTEI